MSHKKQVHTVRSRQKQKTFRTLLSSERLEDRCMLTASTSGDWGWAQQIFGETASPSAVASDSTGNIYIAGSFSGTVDFDPSASTFPLTSAGGADAFVSKYDVFGQFQWAKAFSGTGVTHAQSISLGTSNAIIVSGYFTETADFDPGTNTASLRSAGSLDGFIVSLDAGGNYRWAGRMGSNTNEDDAVYRVCTNKVSGTIFATGVFSGVSTFDFGGSSTSISSGGRKNTFILSIGDDGSLGWVKSFQSNFLNGGYGIATDELSGRVAIVGFLHSNVVDFDPGPEKAIRNPVAMADGYVAVLERDGSFAWAHTFGSVAEDAFGRVLFDENGNVYVSGTFGHSGSRVTIDADPGPQTAIHTSSVDHDIILIKLSSTGNYLWSAAFGGTGNEAPDGFILQDDLLIITGTFENTIDFDPGPSQHNVTSIGSSTVFVLKLNASTGTFRDVVTLETVAGGSSRACGTTEDEAGNIIVLGASKLETDFDPSPNSRAI